MNRPIQYAESCLNMGASAPLFSAHQIAMKAPKSRITKGNRAYQRGLSKHMMKLKRYSARGRIQRKGTTATSWQILLVVARSRTEAQAGRASHSRYWIVDGCLLMQGVSGLVRCP